MAEKQFAVTGYIVNLARNIPTVWQDTTVTSAAASIEVYGDDTRLILYFVHAKDPLGHCAYLPEQNVGVSFMTMDQLPYYLKLLESRNVMVYLDSKMPEQNGLFMSVNHSKSC
ncbi:hypothetical protein Psal006b_03055 [Piscirickettsia salmonis]|uniref:Uncharacterized protein n=1 Tax=Piscirickettsia salmonis TaxID=1238 RepID=A0A1L6TG52_PISSA|nr:hypothetical protein [Piscirickettsia salmonis]AKP74719.1 hypothetical protein PSLF89_3229 [Piscirickettsia salmonis LF-89 = ATCC VR-1361]ALB21357.1 hypothetical protein KU39_171 [Piscirickettsia salmonis]ALY01596.1 hypothetical protein AWE47_00850 [Piscirickettsia salmonis]AMA41108.1 hypothetical protein AWJ11_00845 [Piscirickettsia salmonis]AOS36298.1 hypothetical protein AVM72_13840 [Piscirickettsia salmonis]